MRVVVELLLWAAGLALFFTLVRGFAPLSGIARLALSPVGIVAFVALFLLLRLRPRPAVGGSSS